MFRTVRTRCCKVSSYRNCYVKLMNESYRHFLQNSAKTVPKRLRPDLN